MHDVRALISQLNGTNATAAALRAIVSVAAIALVAASAAATKRAMVGSRLPALAAVERAGGADPAEPAIIVDPLVLDASFAGDSARPGILPAGAQHPAGAVRWFNGRPVRPTRTLVMIVTAYSPDARSCGQWADGQTASLHSVETNAGNLVAADPRVLPMGSMVSVPGYDGGRVVPVLDIGGAIKGSRLDVLFPTHAPARAWGVRTLNVTVWEYADGRPDGDWRAQRDGRAANPAAD